MELPVYALEISEDLNDESSVDFVALVDKPAIQRNFLMFKEQPMQFAIQSEDKQIVSGPLMLADTPIYRSDKNGEYYVTFSPATIETIAQKFFKKGYQSNVNLMHDGNQEVSDVTMFESWIVDPARGISAMKGFEDAPVGSWFGSFKVDNPEVWAKIKAGDFKGFSVEGMFNYKKQEKAVEMAEQMMNKIIEILEQIS
jgi:hypothetical protein